MSTESALKWYKTNEDIIDKHRGGALRKLKNQLKEQARTITAQANAIEAKIAEIARLQADLERRVPRSRQSAIKRTPYTQARRSHALDVNVFRWASLTDVVQRR